MFTPSRQEGLATPHVLDRDRASSNRSGIDYLGRYGGNARVRSELKKFGRSVGLVIDVDNYHKMVRAGFDLVPERDNKSEWSPSAILRPLGRYGNSIPAALIASICAMERDGEPCDECKRSSTSTSNHSERKGAARLAAPTVGGVSTSSGSGSVSRILGRTVCAARRAAMAGGRSENSRGRFAEQFSPEIYGRAKAAVLRLAGAGSRGRAPLEAAEVLDKYVHPQSYSGAPYFCLNGEVPRDKLLRDVESIRRGDRGLQPFVAGRRVQHGELVPKGRLVWMAPLATTILATQYSKPCYEGVVGRKCFAFGQTYRSIGAVITAMQSRRRFVYGLDFSGFDSSISAKLIDDAFGILKTHLDLTSSDDRSMLDRLISDFIHTRLVLPDGTMWRVHRGVPSGSAFTSLVDSVVNLIVLQYIWIRLTGHELDEDDVCVLGDDSVVASNWYLEIGQISEAAKELGMVLSTDPNQSERVRLGQSVPFLGHRWKCGRPRRDPIEIAKRLAFPERWTRFLRDERYSLLRLYSMTADSFDAYMLFFEVTEWTSWYIEDIVLNEIYSVDMPSLMPEMSEKELARALPGRLEFRGRVEQSLSFEIKPWQNLRLFHVGRD